MTRRYQIVGRVMNSLTNHGVQDAKIEAWDKDLLLNDFVGVCITDASGKFQIEVDPSSFEGLFLDRKPDFFFKVFYRGRLIASTEDSVLWNVKTAKTKVLIEINLPETDAPAPSGEIEQNPAATDDPLRRLTAQARQDPQFFHALVFDTENVISRLDYLDRSGKASLLAGSPEGFFVRMLCGVTSLSGGGHGCPTQTCAVTHICNVTVAWF